MLRRDSDMTSGPIFSQLFSFSMPMMVGLLFQLMYSTVDSIVVGNYVGKTALAAVNATVNIIGTLVSFVSSLSVGTGVVVAQCWGARDERNLKTAVSTTFGLTLVFSLVVTGAGILLVRPMLNLMATPGDVYQEAQVYLTIYFAGIAGSFLYNMGSAILRAVGDSTRPLLFLIFAAIVNTVLDLLFVIRFEWGVAGVAWATVIAQFLSAVLVLFVLTREPRSYGLRWKAIRIEKAMTWRILRVGLPSAIQSTIVSFSNVFVQSYINYFGSDNMAAWGCYIKCDHMLGLPSQAISMGVATFVGQNVGAGNLKRAGKGVTTALTMSFLSTLAVGIGVALLRYPIMGLFTQPQDTEVVRLGVEYLLYIAPFYTIHGLNGVEAAALRCVDRAKGPMYVYVGSLVVFRQIYLYAISHWFGGVLHTELAIGCAFPLGWTVATLSMTLVYLFSPLGCWYKEKGKR